MLRSIRTYTTLITLALLGSFIGAANRVQAQTYQIDCAILLCLSGGWPASVPCARARAEFIRRITPWPVEPPLQIWRCPMGASYRSIAPSNEPNRVYDVRYARQHESGRDGDCNRSAVIYLGTYGIQGEFSWARSTPTALPAAHTGLERWGSTCPSIYHRSVFVEWQDYEGNYGYEQVNY